MGVFSVVMTADHSFLIRKHLTTKIQPLFKVMWPFSNYPCWASDPFGWSCTNYPSVLIVSLIFTFYLYVIINDKFCFSDFHRSHIYCQVTQSSNWHSQSHNRIKIQVKTLIETLNRLRLRHRFVLPLTSSTASTYFICPIYLWAFRC